MAGKANTSNDAPLTLGKLELQTSPIIHIGYHKTGSTLLQRSYFTPENGFEPLGNQTEIFENLIAPGPFHFCPDTAGKFFNERCLVARKNGRIPVLSSENLSGNPFLGGDRSKEISLRLQAIWPEARILILVRSQLTMLPSLYMQYLKRAGTGTFRDFFDPEVQVGYPSFHPGHFEYDKLTSQYQSLFEDVTICTFESLKSNSSRFVRGLHTKIGKGELVNLPVKGENKTPSKRSADALRRINHITKGAMNRRPLIPVLREGGFGYRAISRLYSGQVTEGSDTLDNYVRTKFSDRFDMSNQRLKRLVPDLDLSEYPGI